jgi:endonuclease/exonuclease/phosphatase (EEP) superfamily protein YafD
MSDDEAVEPRPLLASLLRLSVWLATAAVGVMAASQAFGTTVLSVLFVLQALTPFVAVGATVLAVVSLVMRMWSAVAVNLLALVGLVVLMLPLVGGVDRPPLPEGTPRLVVAMANVYYENATIDEAAARLLTIDADLLAVVEYNPAAAAALTAAGISERYPYRSEMPRNDRTGLVLFSKLPIASSVVAPIGWQLGIDAVIDVQGWPTRVMVVHPVPGTEQGDVSRWSDDLDAIGRMAADGDLPTVVVGDFNASRWHPAFRHLLGTGLADAHEQVGKGWSRSWPANRFLPAFVRIDHALMRNGVVAVDVLDIEVPGSDHVGFVATLALPATSG